MDNFLGPSNQNYIEISSQRQNTSTNALALQKHMAHIAKEAAGNMCGV